MKKVLIIKCLFPQKNESWTYQQLFTRGKKKLFQRLPWMKKFIAISGSAPYVQKNVIATRFR